MVYPEGWGGDAVHEKILSKDGRRDHTYFLSGSAQSVSTLT